MAQTSYTIVPGPVVHDWNTAASWIPTTGTGTQYPGATTGDSALVTGAFAGVAQTVDLSAVLPNPIVALTLGDISGTGVTTVQTSNANSLVLDAATVVSQGPLVATTTVNVISAPITVTGNLTLGPAFAGTPEIPAIPATPETPEVPAVPAVPAISLSNDLLVSGKITPSAGANRTIINSSGKTVTLGDIDISTGATASIVLTLRNENNLATNRINLHGVIANGGTVAAGVTYDGRINGTIFELGNNTAAQNTYTGTTILQSNGAGARIATFLLNGPGLFGTGVFNLGQVSGSTTILEAINAPRTITNADVRAARSNTFQGTNSINFTGTITTGSSHVVTNTMTGGAQLVFDGPYNLDNTNQTTTVSDSRIRTFAGTGTTVFNGVLADHAAPTADMFGGINLTETGTLIINGTATYQGDTRIAGTGTIQLGNGGTTGLITPAFPNLSYADYILTPGTPPTPTTTSPPTFPNFFKKSVVTGGSAGTGTFAVKHSDDLTLSSTINGGIGLKQIGSGVLTVDTRQFNTGANQVGDGLAPSKLVVTGQSVGESTQTGDFGPPIVHGTGYNTFYQIVTNLQDTSLLRVGQPAYITTASAAVYIHSIDSATQVTLLGTGVSSAATGLIPGQNATGAVVGQAIKFGAGSGLGTSAAVTTVKALSTLGGTGAIAGAVIVDGILAPGIGVGTLATGPLTFHAGSTLAVEIDSAAGTADKVVVTGNVATGGTTTHLALTDLGGGTLASGTKLVLVDYTGSWPTTDVLTYGGNPVADGSTITVGSNTFTVSYADPAVDGTALTLTVGGSVPVSPFQTWINGYSTQLPNAADRLPTADPDNDGRDNLLEYALDGNPADGANNGKLTVSTQDSGDLDALRDLSITLAVRSGAALGVGPDGSATLTVDGLIYTIQGSQNLQTWDKAINEVIPASVLNPAPATGWTTRTFQVTDSNGLPEKRFIRVGVK